MVHADQALMTFCVGNTKVEPKGNGKLITQAAAGTAKSTHSWRPSYRVGTSFGFRLSDWHGS
jgi:hypothetical protein